MSMKSSKKYSKHYIKTYRSKEKLLATPSLHATHNVDISHTPNIKSKKDNSILKKLNMRQFFSINPNLLKNKPSSTATNPLIQSIYSSQTLGKEYCLSPDGRVTK